MLLGNWWLGKDFGLLVVNSNHITAKLPCLGPQARPLTLNCTILSWLKGKLILIRVASDLEPFPGKGGTRETAEMGYRYVSEHQVHLGVIYCKTSISWTTPERSTQSCWKREQTSIHKGTQAYDWASDPESVTWQWPALPYATHTVQDTSTS